MAEITQIDVRQQARDAVREKWVMDEENYPALKYLTDPEQQLNFKLKHVLFHIINWVPAVEWMIKHDADRFVEIFPPHSLDNAMAKKYREAIGKMLIHLFKLEELLQVQVELYEEESGFTIAGQYSYLMKDLLKSCEKADHGERIQRQKIIDRLELCFSEFNYAFSSKRRKTPWNIVCEYLK